MKIAYLIILMCKGWTMPTKYYDLEFETLKKCEANIKTFDKETKEKMDKMKKYIGDSFTSCTHPYGYCQKVFKVN